MDVNLVRLSVDWVLFLCLFKVLLIFNADFCFDKDGLCVFGSFRPDCEEVPGVVKLFADFKSRVPLS